MTNCEQQSIASVETWHVPPVCAGQMVEVSYGADWESEILWRRETDRSTREVSYARASLGGLRPEDWEPWNAEPRITDWEDVSPAHRAAG